VRQYGHLERVILYEGYLFHFISIILICITHTYQGALNKLQADEMKYVEGIKGY